MTCLGVDMDIGSLLPKKEDAHLWKVEPYQGVAVDKKDQSERKGLSGSWELGAKDE